ncbi:MAG TPA: hypothetical protein DCS07_13575 [Bdellovibrionales bacterium]|nr:MAG: hypothetical protein A2Z97_05100 [Bdellovibrionales bacterium GWB1_52_6]OFZ04567.1 MAG: hypothetical protein A2X97_13175 [Bdellovibrionales bacterium GWA1_52_35]OFZ42946.1 MAG: hypothetical protein A2070_10335 [Bdellovibrionales bacterium GWC1_52_8]HAR43638.1 hypothetical protein [Bdellovibrionales bacterium]HCM39978.1 hypothetical protein [Bdellovibrionales bacterium]
MKTKILILAALVTGVVSTSYARQDVFFELIEKRAATAAERNAQAQRTPAQSPKEEVKKDPQAQFERTTAKP